jgi:hypothetical protein
MIRSLCHAFFVAGLAFQAALAEDVSTSLEDVLGGCAEETPGSTNLLQTQLSLNKRQVHEAHKDRGTGNISATTKTTTPPATGVGQNGVGNLPTFITGLVTDFCVIAACIWIFSLLVNAEPHTFRKRQYVSYQRW